MFSSLIARFILQVYYKYLIDYPLGKKLRHYVLFYVSQLKYDQLDGRKSALEMLTVLVKVFPMVKRREIFQSLDVNFSLITTCIFRTCYRI